MTTHRESLLESFGITDIGLVREHNEDAWAAYPSQGLFLLADGMGGHAAGEVASREAIEYFHLLFNDWVPPKNHALQEVKTFFEQSFSKVNLRIYEEGQLDHELKGMGTTLCVLHLYASAVIVAHVGDSRIYRLRGQELKQLTQDHSLVNEMLALGAIKPEESATFPYKHILTKAIGTHARVEPSISVTDRDCDDFFLLCSDGLTNYATDQQIAHILLSHDSLPSKGRQLIDLANEQGGGDNISAIIIHDLSR